MQPTEPNNTRRLFYFYIFQKYFLQKYIFDFTIYSFIPLPPGGRGRDIYVNKNIFYLRGGLGGSQPPPYRAAGPSPQNCSSGPLDVVLDILDTNKNH
jgi:hypothetical protein